MATITRKMLKDYISFQVSPGYYKNLNAKGKEFYRKKLSKDISKGKKISI